MRLQDLLLSWNLKRMTMCACVLFFQTGAKQEELPRDLEESISVIDQPYNRA